MIILIFKAIVSDLHLVIIQTSCGFSIMWTRRVYKNFLWFRSINIIIQLLADIYDCIWSIVVKIHAFRITKDKDLKKEIIKFISNNKIKSGCILTCVGHLTKAKLRMSDGKTIKDFEKEFEIVSMVGTVGNKDAHLHVSLSDINGNCIGGHLKGGCIVGVTAEVVIAEFEEYSFLRESDKDTGYDELVIK